MDLFFDEKIELAIERIRKFARIAKTMWCALMDVKCDRDDFPYDADDFSRCYGLYRFCRTHTSIMVKY